MCATAQGHECGVAGVPALIRTYDKGRSVINKLDARGPVEDRRGFCHGFDNAKKLSIGYKNCSRKLGRKCNRRSGQWRADLTIILIQSSLLERKIGIVRNYTAIGPKTDVIRHEHFVSWKEIYIYIRIIIDINYN